MKVLVTGGAGFIGTRLVQRLAELKHEVTAVDVRPAENVTLADVRDLSAMEEVVSRVCPEAVYHLAGPVAEAVRRDLHASLDLQSRGTLAVLESCRRLPEPPKVILASSFYVYAGVAPEAVVNEATSLDLLALEPFGASKLMAERMVIAYADAYGLQYVNLRFGSVYGHGNCSNAVKSFLEAGLRRETVEVWGQGKRRNQYTFVDDVVEGCVKALVWQNATVNLVSDEVTTTLRLATLLRQLYSVEAVFDVDKDEPKSMAYIVPIVAKDLGWRATPLESGVKQMAEQMGVA